MHDYDDGACFCFLLQNCSVTSSKTKDSAIGHRFVFAGGREETAFVFTAESFSHMLLSV